MNNSNFLKILFINIDIGGFGVHDFGFPKRRSRLVFGVFQQCKIRELERTIQS